MNTDWIARKSISTRGKCLLTNFKHFSLQSLRSKCAQWLSIGRIQGQMRIFKWSSGLQEHLAWTRINCCNRWVSTLLTRGLQVYWMHLMWVRLVRPTWHWRILLKTNWIKTSLLVIIYWGNLDKLSFFHLRKLRWRCEKLTGLSTSVGSQ